MPRTIAEQFNASRKAKREPAMPAELTAEGYRLEHGSESDAVELQGGYWWTLLRAGWTECESGRTFKDPQAAIASAHRHMAREMARPVNQRWS